MTKSSGHKPDYGSVSPPKWTEHHHHYETHRLLQGGDEPESATLTTGFSYLRGGKAFRSRERISRFLDHSKFGVALDALLAIVSIAFAGSYIANTYIPKNDLPWLLWATELICALLFTIDYLFCGIYLANRRFEYLFSLPSLINLVVILPVLPFSFYIRYHTLWYGATYWRFVYPFRFFKCYIECKSLLSRGHAYMTPVRQFAVLCYLQIVLIIAGAAGIVQIAETSNGDYSVTHLGEWTFFNAFFNCILVFLTIGAPPADNLLAKVFIGVLVVVLILVVPYQISQVLDLGKAFTHYEMMSCVPSARVKHIVLCGDLTASRIDHFFHEVFHDDHDVVDINVVVMSSEPPSTTMMALLMDPFFEKRTSFIQGSILDMDDARRAAVQSADAIFILTRRCAPDAHMASDHRTFMRVLAAKRLAPRARLFAQMHLARNRHLLDDVDVKDALYFSEVMNSMFGQDCVCPGFSTFIYNLTSSEDNSLDSEDVTEAAETESTSATATGYENWKERYLHGASHELYSVRLPQSDVIFGRSFAEVASLVYADCDGVVLFAVVSASKRILLNPGDSYTCAGGETAFVIAKNRRDADRVTKLKGGTESAAASASTWNSYKNGYKSLLQSAGSMGKSKRSTTQSSDATRGFLRQRRASKVVDWEATMEADVELLKEEEQHERDADESEALVSPLRMRCRSLEQSNGVPLSTTTLVTPNDVSNVVVSDLAGLRLSAAPIVVCIASATAFPDHLEFFIGPLRVKALQQHRPVVILTQTLPSPSQYATFRRFSHVYFVTGDLFQRDTLLRGGVRRAHRIVIMGDDGDGLGDVATAASSSELLADATSVALHKSIVLLVGADRAPRVITELVNRANVHFITQNLLACEWFPAEANGASAAPGASTTYALPVATSSMEFSRDFCVSPAFASGLAYSTSLCDSLMINQFFNPMVGRIMREFIFASWKEEQFDETPRYNQPGKDDTNGNTPIASSPASLTTSPTTRGVLPSSLFTVEVPLDFVGKTFEYVFHYLLSSDGILTLGLYRCRPDYRLETAGNSDVNDCSTKKARIEIDEHERSVPFGYVYVNPYSQDKLSGNDLLYVLAQKQPQWA